MAFSLVQRQPDQNCVTEDKTLTRVEHEQQKVVMIVPEENPSTMTHGDQEDREIIVIPIKSSSMRVLTAATLKTSAIDIDVVRKYYKPHKDAIVSIREMYEEPGLLGIEIVNGTSIEIEHKSKSVVFHQNIFSCGKCLNRHSFRKYDVKKHVVKCAILREKKQQSKINKNKRQQRWRVKRKIEAAAGGRPLPKQSKTSSASNSCTKVPVNHSDINLSQNHEEFLGEKASTNSSELEGEIEYIEKEQRNVDTLINLGPTSETMHSIFKVKDLNFVRYYCTTGNTKLGTVWKPSNCPSGLVENDECRIYFHGFTTRTRVFAFPLPFFLRHRQLQCKNHKKVFSYFSQEVADQLPVDVFLTEDIVAFERTLMTREFYGDLIRESEAHVNPTRMHKTITLKWIDNALTYLARDARQQRSKHLSESSGKVFNLELPQWDKLKPLRSLTPKMITKIIQTEKEGTGLGVHSLQQKAEDINLKENHIKSNGRHKIHADLLMSRYESGCGFLQGNNQSQNPVSYILQAKKIQEPDQPKH